MINQHFSSLVGKYLAAAELIIPLGYLATHCKWTARKTHSLLLRLAQNLLHTWNESFRMCMYPCACANSFAAQLYFSWKLIWSPRKVGPFVSSGRTFWKIAAMARNQTNCIRCTSHLRMFTSHFKCGRKCFGFVLCFQFNLELTMFNRFSQLTFADIYYLNWIDMIKF